MAELVIAAVAHTPRALPEVRRVDLRVRDGEVLAVVGATYADTSPIIAIASGREIPASGAALIRGIPVTDLPIESRPAVVGGGLPPQLSRSTVRQALIGAAREKLGGRLAAVRADELAEQLGMRDELKRQVRDLSEPQRHRLELALGFLRSPDVILFDDPLRDLSQPERLAIIGDLGRLLSDPGVTAVYATTDASQAVVLGERLAVASNGEIQQVGTPAQIIEAPVSLKVAQLVAGELLRTEVGELSTEYLELPAGRLRRPDYVPPPPGQSRSVVYGAWRRPDPEDLETRAVDEHAAAVWWGLPDLVFDADTGERLDRPARLLTRNRGAEDPRAVAARVLNVIMTVRTSRRIPPGEPLESDASYRLTVWIAAHDEHSIVANALEHLFPDTLLPPSKVGHRLQVTAHGTDVTIHRPLRELYLPTHGASPPISFGLKTPKDEGEGTVRLAIWHRRHLLQSALVDLRWGAGVTPSHGARIDFSVSDLDDVGRFPQRDVSLLVNETTSDVHRIIVNGASEKPFSVTLYERQMLDMLDAARAGLDEAHRDSKGRTRFRKDNSKAKDAFVTDLINLAHKGAALVQVAFPTRKQRGALLSDLRAASVERQGRAVVQVCQASGSRLDFPWHLIYDIGLEALALGRERPCRILDELWQPTTEPSRIPAVCPYAGEHALNTICPFGFWGFAHILELPPSTMDPSENLPLCARDGALTGPFAVVVSRRLDAKQTDAHLAQLPQSPRHDVYDTVPGLKGAMDEPERELVYFYCHGGHLKLAAFEAPSPVLEIGKGQFVATGDINAWASPEGGWAPEHWEAVKPLIVINGCHTTDVSPARAADFVASFMGAGAAGVVGTEVMMDQPVASEAGAALVRSIVVEGASVGGALQAMRRELLAKGNVMGLAYTAYCSASLTLRCGTH